MADVTLLDLVNQVRHMLREPAVTSISDTDDATQALLPLIYEAQGSVLESRDWDFDKRHDGATRFLARQTGTTVVTSILSANVEIETNLVLLLSGGHVVRFRVPSDSQQPNISYRVKTIDTYSTGGRYILNLDNGWTGSLINSTASGWEAYMFEVPLPLTVRKVTSVINENVPTRLVFSEEDILFDSMVPLPHLVQQDNTTTVMVGGTATSTEVFTSATSSFGGITGLRMAVWPIPDTNHQNIRFRYYYRHPELVNATDTLVNVPRSVTSLIGEEAYRLALLSNIEADPARAIAVGRSVLAREERIAATHAPASGRRRVPRPMGTGRGIYHPNRFWNTPEVPSP